MSRASPGGPAMNSASLSSLPSADPQPTATAPPPSAPSGRAANGRFAPGNKCGKGNPHAQKVAELRRVIMETMTAKDTAEMVHAMMVQSKQGNVAATRLLWSYGLGKP